METSNNAVFCSDFSMMASCLLTIQAQEQAGLYTGDEALMLQLDQLRNDLLRKLYVRTLSIAGSTDNNNPGPSGAGDYSGSDFSSVDFQTGNQGGSGDLGGTFQATLTLFGVLCGREATVSEQDRDELATVFVQVLDAFLDLKTYLKTAGFNPCAGSAQAFNNSADIRLQAAGSDGSNGIQEGILLRWQLQGELGNAHIPQGNYANNQIRTTGYNRPDDYVYISRTPYTAPVPFTVDFSALRPAVSASKHQWTYFLNMTRDDRHYSNIVSIVFNDAAAYLQQLRLFDPATDPAAFLDGYHGELEIIVQEKTIFKFGLHFQKRTLAAASVKISALAVLDEETDGETPVLRDDLSFSDDQAGKTYTNENICRIRLRTDANAVLKTFSFETYHDFLNSRVPDAWTAVGTGFGLSLDDATVYRRLEDPGQLDIDQRWPQYRDGTTVRVANYHDKWASSTASEPAIKAVVGDYLAQSQSGGSAVINVNLSGSADDPGTLLRYIDLLNLQSVDYHIARMFGLGHIDVLGTADLNTRFVYRMNYTNMTSASGTAKTLTYLGIPVGTGDPRLPAKPVMRPISYQVSDSGAQTQSLFDEQGYSLTGRVRLINIGRLPQEAEIAEADFWDGSVAGALFDHGKQTSPVLYGIEYRPAIQDDYVLPYITHGDNGDRQYYAYNAGYQSAHQEDIPETLPLLDNPLSLFVHQEKNEGVHFYAVYGIDLFARASALSDPLSTDETIFPPLNLLKPPTDLAVQYIQAESTLVFTAQREQDWLEGRQQAFPGADVSFTRLTFNWIDVSDVSTLDPSVPGYLSSVIKGDQLDTFFRDGEPLQVSGQIGSVREVTESVVVLAAVEYNSFDGTLQRPVIADADLEKFTGSFLLTPDGQYKVLSVINAAPGSGPAGLFFTVEKNLVTERVDGDPSSQSAISTRTYYTAPVKGLRFTVAENLGEPGNWRILQQHIGLTDLSDPLDPVIETVYDEYANPHRFWYGGVHAQATVGVALDVSGRPMAGYYKITCDSGTTLAPPAQHMLPFDPANPGLNPPEISRDPFVEWYNGKIFLQTISGGAEKKLVDVVAIKETSPLTLYALDPDYLNPDALILTEALTERVIPVNYHPGYRVYLFPEPPPADFNRGKLLPASNANDKKSLLALQTIRRSGALPVYTSAISLPAVLLALNILEPVQPEPPQAATLKVRPDATGKAAFTFDIPVLPGPDQFRREPFGWMFYRTHNELVLYSLYLPGTVDEILNRLNSFQDDPYFADRYLGLLDLQFDPAQPGFFRSYPAVDQDGLPVSYGFPVPDQPGLNKDSNGQTLPAGAAGLIANYEQALHRTLLPLTEQIPILNYIAVGTQTENKAPVIRTIDGALMSAGDQGFDPFPMIRQHPVNKPASYYIRFTDYNLNASARFLYFYAAAEVTNKLAVGELSGFTGPVTVLHTSPGQAPVIRSYAIGVNTGNGESPVIVTFSLSPIPVFDQVVRARIYRTTDPEKTNPLTAMDFSLDVVPEVDPFTGGLTITDNFADTAAIPFGEKIHYRLSFIRNILNETEQPEDIISLGSDVVTLTLIDMFNPEAPELNYDGTLHQINWAPAANKATYYVYQQNARGNWQQMAKILPGEALIYPTGILNPTDEDGNILYYRFKVRVQNSSGLFNLTDKEITLTA